ncbi:PIN domain-containing protein [Pararhizobium sp. LjRoot255]|uniref:PIN domain-containing protein n=1 Tax=Pararhizobium sp. LjRoot255 TaxID=3342298 RepID=UPI003ED08017
MTAFHGRILSVDVEIAKKCAALHVPDRRPDAGALIAATALHHNFILVTRNTRDFMSTGVQLLNPWET